MLIMLPLGEGLNRTSLAGFIIAMGMLVDNAIVVVDNARRAIDRGVPAAEALVAGASAPKWNLLGATLIGVCSFLPLQMASSAVAEMVKPLFTVLAVSLMLSWVLALTQTPLTGLRIMRPKKHAGDADPYYSIQISSLIFWSIKTDKADKTIRSLCITTNIKFYS